MTAEPLMKGSAFLCFDQELALCQEGLMSGIKSNLGLNNQLGFISSINNRAKIAKCILF